MPTPESSAKAAGPIAAALSIAICIGLLLSFAPFAASADLRPTDRAGGAILLRSGEIVAPSDPDPLASLMDLRGLHALVQLNRVPDAAQREALASEGVRLLHYVPDRAWLAAVDPHARPLTAARLIRFADEIPPVNKMSLRVREMDFESHAVTPDGLVHLSVHFFKDVDLRRAREIVSLHGGGTEDEVSAVNALMVAIDEDAIAGLAGEDAVMWMEVATPPFGPRNDLVRAVTHAGLVNEPPYELDGSGVNAFVYDGALVEDAHPDLVGRVIQAQGGEPMFHSTHVAGTVGGNGALSEGTYAGMAPGVTIISAYVNFISPIIFYNNPGDMEQDYRNAIKNYDADVSNNSIGSNVAQNNFDCSWEGDYETSAATIDAIVRGESGGPIVIVWANGNERGSGRCGKDFFTTAPPSPAKNHIAVGAINSDDRTMTDFSSWGPTDDGRMRPDVSAPGCQSSGDRGTTSTVTMFGNPGYASLCGTSMAAPAVAGVAALMIQQHRISHEDQTPSNSLVKALMINTAEDLGAPGPDYKYGFGLVDAAAAVGSIEAGAFVETEVSQDQVVDLAFYVYPESPHVKVSMAWDDPPGTPSASLNLVNNLDLVLVDPSGAEHLPWVLDPSDPDRNAQIGIDVLNNAEQVEVESPASGPWIVRVRGLEVPEGPQTVSVTYTGLSTCDLDEDGYLREECLEGTDCNDLDSSVNPGADEVCGDAVDNNCDGQVDEGCDEDQGTDDDDDDGGCGGCASVRGGPGHGLIPLGLLLLLASAYSITRVLLRNRPR